MEDDKHTIGSEKMYIKLGTFEAHVTPTGHQYDDKSRMVTQLKKREGAAHQAGGER